MRDSIAFKDYHRSASRRSKYGKRKTKEEADRSFIFSASAINCALISVLKTRPKTRRAKRMSELVREFLRPGPEEIIYFGPEYMEILHEVLYNE